MFQGAIEMFREGGFGMFPTLGFGVWALYEALRQARRPTPRHPASIALALATVLAGTLGTLTGIIKTLGAASSAPPPEHLTLVLIGVSESLHNLVLALILVLLTVLAFAAGSLRRPVP